MRIASAQLIFTAALAVAATGAHATGFNQKRIGHYDFLHQGDTDAVRFTATHVVPDRSYSNGSGVAGGTTETDANPPFTLTTLEARTHLNDDLKCLAQLGEPLNSHAELGNSWAAGNDQVSSKIKSLSLEGTCAIDLNERDDANYFMIAGASLNMVEVKRNTNNLAAITRMEVENDTPALGYSLGVGYEIPEFALRTELVWHSPIKYELSGNAYDLVAAGPTVIPGPTAITSTLRVPEAIELRFQSGFAPNWLGDIGIKWQEWKKLESLDVPELGASLKTQYRNGYELSAGVGHLLNEDTALSGRYRYIKGIEGGYTDLHILSGGARTKVSDGGYVLGMLSYIYVDSGSNSGTSLAGSAYSYDIDKGSALALTLGFEQEF